MKLIQNSLFIFLLIRTCVFGVPLFDQDDFESMERGSFAAKVNDTTILYLRPNTTQLFTELYQRYGLLHNPELNVIERAPYLDQVGAPPPFPLQPANTAIFDHAESLLKAFHERSGNLNLFLEPGNQEVMFYTASGSAQIINGLVYAMATTFPDQNFLFVEKIPFYSGHRNAVLALFDYPNVRWQGFQTPSEIMLKPGETLIEFVTSPNNPDGMFRAPETNAQIIIGDFVFASSAYGDGTGYLAPNLAWVDAARASGKILFSFNSASKQFGKTGCRCGYLWFPLNHSFSSAIFPKFFSYISVSTIGASTAGLSEFLDLISAFLERNDIGQKLRSDAHASLAKRFQILSQAIVARYPGSSIVSIAGSPALFVQLSDPRLTTMSAREIIFDDLQVSVSGGVPFGATDAFFRVNLTGYSIELAELANRLSGTKKYHADDFLISSEHVCARVKVCGMKKQKTLYVVNPNNCVIEADAKAGSIIIELPPFIDYQFSNIITIKKTDRSRHRIIVKSGNFKKILTNKRNQIRVQWQQPNFLDGNWTIQHLSRCD